jgi:Cys-tRNA(Pro)/Cys-tRNA(Cys) deacylase
MSRKPLAIRMLEQRGIAHEVVAFSCSIRSAGAVAEATGAEPQLVYKTLVVEEDPPRARPYLVMVPADTEVDLKVLAASLGAKKLRMASHRQAEAITGLPVGGISALALLERKFPTLIDQRCLDCSSVLVSAGQRGCDVRLKVSDLIELTGARPVRTTL